MRPWPQRRRGARCRRRGRAPGRGRRHRLGVLVGEDRRGRRPPARRRRPRGAPRPGRRRRRGCGRRRGRSAAAAATSSRRPGTAIAGGHRGDPPRVELAAPRKASAAAIARAKLRRWNAPAAAQLAARRRGPRGRGPARAPRSAAVRSASARDRSGRPDPGPGSWRRAAPPSFSAAISGLGLPQPLGVVEPDRGQDGHLRGDRVGRVEPAAEARLDHRHLDPGGGEGDERGRGCDLELGHRLALLERPVDDLGRLAPCARPRPRTRPAPISAPPIRMRSDQRAGCGERQAPVRSAVGLEQRRGHPRHRGLAVGADDVDRGEAVLGHAQQRVEPVHPVEPELPADRLQRVEVGRPALYPSSSSSPR